MLDALDRCMEEIVERRSAPPVNLSGRFILNPFRELFQEWNKRLESQG